MLLFQVFKGKNNTFNPILKTVFKKRVLVPSCFPQEIPARLSSIVPSLLYWIARLAYDRKGNYDGKINAHKDLEARYYSIVLVSSVPAPPLIDVSSHCLRYHKPTLSKSKPPGFSQPRLPAPPDPSWGSTSVNGINIYPRSDTSQNTKSSLSLALCPPPKPTTLLPKYL